MKNKTITQTVTLPSPPSMVFSALMDEKKHGGFTGAPAQIDARVGGAFRCYGDYIRGITLELETDKRIVQAWRSQGWPKGYYSIVSFILSGGAGGKTKLRFSQVGVPAADFKAKSGGWRTHYWEPLKRQLKLGSPSAQS